MTIDGRELTDDDAGRVVWYEPAHFPADRQRGVISSWNNTTVFVCYYPHIGGRLSDQPQATSPCDLVWAPRGREAAGLEAAGERAR